MAFSKEVRIEIRKRDDNEPVSVVAGYDFGSVECAHYNHDRNFEGYNSPDNGEVQNRPQHYINHMVAAHEGIDNGLDYNGNVRAAQLIWSRMTEDERAYLFYLSHNSD